MSFSGEVFSQGSGGNGTVPRAVLSLRGVDGKGREGGPHEVPLSLCNEMYFLRHMPLLGQLDKNGVPRLAKLFWVCTLIYSFV